MSDAVLLGSAEKRQLLRDYFDRFGPFRFVVETGIWNGCGSCFQFEGEAEVVAIESNDESAKRARANGHDVQTGDSAVVLPALLATRVDGPALFWLDAHLVAEAGEPNHSPLLAELDAIRDWPHAARSVALIDDVRMMGRDGWPSVKQVLLWLAASKLWRVHVIDDVLRLTPR